MQEYSPGIEINDVGFGQTADRRAYSTEIEYNDQTPSGLLRGFRNYGTYLFTSHAYNFDGLSVLQQIGGGMYGQRAKSLWTPDISGGYQASVYSDRLLRGGPVARVPASWYGNAGIGTDPRKRYVLRFSLSARGDEVGTYDRSVFTSVDVRPRSFLRVVLSPSLSRGRVENQYVTRATDPLATATFGSRYIFAAVDQTTFSVSTRLNWTFTPRMTLEMVAQPFVASGAYSNFKEFLTPRRLEFARYGVDGASTLVRDSTRVTLDPDGTGAARPIALAAPDFTVRSLRGSAVMRWEYRPGSTLFFVWQQQRNGSSSAGTLGAGDFSRAFREPAQNVLLVKASYWLSR